MNTTVCFIGHRNVPDTHELRSAIKSTLINLIENKKASRFLFGSRSDFNTICHEVLTDLKAAYPFIVRVSYPCNNESAIYESKKSEYEKTVLKIAGKMPKELYYDEIRSDIKESFTGKAAYIKRNKAMIDESDLCVFYFDAEKQKGGTAAAYKYAIEKSKNVINIY